jgi:hypothetical protein
MSCKRWIVAVAFVSAVGMPTQLFAACEFQKEMRDNAKAECERLGGTSEEIATKAPGFFGLLGLLFAPSAERACNIAKEKQAQLELCLEQAQFKEEYKVENAKFESARAVEEAKRDAALLQMATVERETVEAETRQVEIEAKVTDVVNRYTSNLTTAEGEYTERVRALAIEYASRGLDLESPAVDEQFKAEAKVIEKDCTRRLLLRMLQQ